MYICIDISLVPYYIYKQITRKIYIYIYLHLGCLMIYSYRCISSALGPPRPEMVALSESEDGADEVRALDDGFFWTDSQSPWGAPRVTS